MNAAKIIDSILQACYNKCQMGIKLSLRTHAAANTAVSRKQMKEGLLMEQKNLRKTNGIPLYLGLAAGVLILIGTILQSGVMTAYLNDVYAKLGLSINVNSTLILVGLIVGFLIYPGIYLILLLAGANTPRRGTAFAVVWIVFSALGILSELKNVLAPDSSLKDLSNQLVPGGFYLYSLLGLIGQICVLVSCILLLKRLHTPPEQSQTPDVVSQ